MTSERPVAIVTGASSGIGRACAEALGAEGYRVALCARRAAALEDAAARIKERGGEAFVHVADLADEAETASLARETLARFGRVDLLVNNAGYSGARSVEEQRRTELRHIFDVNLLAGLQLIAELVPSMRAQGAGRIINLSSAAGWVPAPLAAPYAATKAAMNMATDCLRLELAPWNIHVSLVAPGFVDTAVFDNARDSVAELRADPEHLYREPMEKLDDFSARQLERAMTPEQVARFVLRVARARKPRPVYFLPRSLGWAGAFFAVLPKRLGDRILLRTYGL